MTAFQRELSSLTRPVWYRLAFTVVAILVSGFVFMVLHAHYRDGSTREARHAVVDR